MPMKAGAVRHILASFNELMKINLRAGFWECYTCCSLWEFELLVMALNNGAVMAGRLLEGNVFLVLKHEPIVSLKFQINPNHDGNQPPLQDKQGLEQQPN
ncbi:hypothetical protein WN944_024454 [Citrus x changshan-huyou]|uniref:Uncharacterized protein n=1 Tax=Citrus x changshan-huyou TaxID=2935761 RepID=A0AAP0LNL6_9ROSI